MERFTTEKLGKARRCPGCTHEKAQQPAVVCTGRMCSTWQAPQVFHGLPRPRGLRFRDPRYPTRGATTSPLSSWPMMTGFFSRPVRGVGRGSCVVRRAVVVLVQVAAADAVCRARAASLHPDRPAGSGKSSSLRSSTAMEYGLRAIVNASLDNRPLGGAGRLSRTAGSGPSARGGRNRHGRRVPDMVHVLAKSCDPTRNFSGGRANVQDRHGRPALGVCKRLIHLSLAVRVGLEVCEHEVRIPFHQSVQQRLEQDAYRPREKKAFRDEIDRGTQVRVRLIVEAGAG